ncbi:heterokaryon incompatibility protein-domain-containing protein [Lophiotrema nucula]|uniref:Heterokaryon incompatibility protein-domain-containing protein n=1 Tax=Lophiotrema nucula TaxID=690887 RepID=A0A6A5YG27_9PLEO|nr:heterokaryon incompatibility protein-domain-containing protein [Lophiotrema nucula]
MIHLLHFENGRVAFEHYPNDREPPDFAILSHTWYPDHEEVKYKEIMENSGQDKKGFQKIRLCGEQAKKDGYQYFWVDTCSIDKTNNSELSEAINSMYRWYADAKICYAYLTDVNGMDWEAFENSRWFKRGWTLQELLAPKTMRFYNSEWQYLGDKSSLGPRISKITGIDLDVLQNSARIPEYSIAERMSWAAGRETSRVEDRAYSLLGIFGIDDMPMMYGQGETAFRRLQERIMEKSDDYSIFAWQGLQQFGPGLLATSPDAFASSESIKPTLDDSNYKLSKQMIDISMKLKPYGPFTYLGLLNCTNQSNDSYSGIFLRQLPASKRYARVAYNGDDFDSSPREQISIYQDIDALIGRMRGTDYTDVPSIGFRIPAQLLSVSYTAKVDHELVRWDASQRTFTIPAGVTTTQGMIGSLQLEQNKFGIEVVRVGFDKNSNPVCMLAKSYGLSPSVGCKIA